MDAFAYGCRACKYVSSPPWERWSGRPPLKTPVPTGVHRPQPQVDNSTCSTSRRTPGAALCLNPDVPVPLARPLAPCLRQTEDRKASAKQSRRAPQYQCAIGLRRGDLQGPRYVHGRATAAVATRPPFRSDARAATHGALRKCGRERIDHLIESRDSWAAIMHLARQWIASYTPIRWLIIQRCARTPPNG